MKDLILDMKYHSPENWGDICGLIAEIDSTNFKSYLEDEDLKDYFLFYKDATCGERLQKGDYVFLYVWNSEILNSQPGILGYFIIDEIDFAKKEEAWKQGDQNHSTFDKKKTFDKYFQQTHVLKFRFNEIHVVSEKHFYTPEYVINYSQLLTEYLKLGKEDDLFDMEEKLPSFKIGNTYLRKDVCYSIKEVIDKSGVIRKVGPEGVSDPLKTNNFQNDVNMDLIESKKQRLRTLQSNIIKNYQSIGSYEGFLGNPMLPEVYQEHIQKKEIDKLVDQNIKFESEFKDLVYELSEYPQINNYTLFRDKINNNFERLELDNVVLSFREETFSKLEFNEEDFRNLVESINYVKSKLDAGEITLPSENDTIKEELNKTSSELEHDVSLSNKLKLTIPIIPFILSYESELGLNHKYSVSMKELWKKVKNVFKGK